MRSLPLLVLLAACPPPPVQKPPPVVVQPPPPPPPPPPPVADKGLEPAQPTLRLPKNFTPVGYKALLTIDPTKPTFDGTITITGNVSERSSVIWLHGRKLDVKRAAAGAVKGTDPYAAPHATTSTLTVTPHGEDLLEVRSDPPLDPGTWQLSFDYTGQIESLNTTGAFAETVAGAHYVFTQFEAIYARRVFPCVDEPDSKVPWQLSLDVPKDLVAVSNTPEVGEKSVDVGWKRVEFAPTKPLPSYLVAFGVGPFDVIDAGKTKSGIPVRIVTLKGRAADAAWAVKETPHILDQLEDWFGIPYAYPKLDMLTIPLTIGFGAMENAGLVTYTERGMLFEQTHPAQARKHGYVMTTAHELAHQWFGDYVTTAWWDDIWLNEGFANWLETKIAARIEPSWHDELAQLSQRNGALAADAQTTARRIRQPIETPSDILNVFDGITYDKGASVMNMFENYVGPETFQKGVRAYMQARAYGNATSADFVGAISTAAGKDLAPAFATFLDQGGAPEIEVTMQCGRGQPRVSIAQHRYVPPGAAPPPPGKPWIFPVCVAFEKDGKRAEQCTLVEQPEADLALDTAKCPRWVWPNVGGHGYYRTHLSAQQVTALRDEAWPLLTWTERRALFFDVEAESHLRPPAKLPLPLALSFVPKMLAGGDRFTIDDALALPLGLDWLVADDQRGKYEGWLRTLFGPGATQLGALPKDADDLDAESTRVALVGTVAYNARDPELAKQAVALAEHWRDLPQAMRGTILHAAVDASPEIQARIEAEVKKETDRHHRNEMIGALAAVRDPARHEQVLQLVLDPALDIRDTLGILYGAPNEATRAVTEKFFRAHDDELMKRLPQDETSGGVRGLAFLFTRACDPKRRDDIADYVTKRFASLPGGQRVVKNAIEAMDQCIATKAVLEPEVRAWLGGWKPPPAKKDKDANRPKDKKSKK